VQSEAEAARVLEGLCTVLDHFRKRGCVFSTLEGIRQAMRPLATPALKHA
jgi:hypothetical protein